MNAKELFDQGKLAEAIQAQTQEVKSKPNDTRLRTFLFELYCFNGQLERATKQLEVIAQQDPDADWATQVYQNILRAESSRRKFIEQGTEPGFLLDPPDYVRRHVQAAAAIAAGNGAEAKQLLDEADKAHGKFSGTLGEQAFEEFRDCDDLFAPVLELIILFDYIWVPLEQVRELEVSPPEHPRDLIWAPVRLALSDGSQRRGYTPVLYPLTYQHDDDSLKLGRQTDWHEVEDGPVLGIGQRDFLVGDDVRSVLELNFVRFNHSSS